MKIVLNSEQMRYVDDYTIHKAGVSARTLMERAAQECVSVLWEKLIPRGEEMVSIAVLAGIGNNGGDALAMVRFLRDDAGRRCQPLQVRLLVVGNPEQATIQWQEQWKLLRKELEQGTSCFSFERMHLLPEMTYDDDRLLEFISPCHILVDGLFGIGLSREVSGLFAQVLRVAEQGSYPRLAIDMPSGVSADTGNVLGMALRADITVTFGYLKWGQVLEPGRSQWCGTVLVKEIGFSEEALELVPGAVTPEGRGYQLKKEDVKAFLPKRTAYSHKGTYGNVFVVGGAKGMSGAITTSGEAAYRTGCGLVTVSSCEENRSIVQLQLPEAVYMDWQMLQEMELWKKASAVVLGPGLGKTPQSLQLVKQAFFLGDIPLVLDADALNLIAEEEELQKQCQCYQGAIIMTPHIQELARLLHCERETVQQDLPGAARRCARAYGAICVAKDAVTTVAAPEGYIWFNSTGNSGMATGGSGDALAGIIGGLLAQKMPPYRAAAVGVWLHGAAGDVARDALGERSVMARDIVAGISPVLRQIDCGDE